MNTARAMPTIPVSDQDHILGDPAAPVILIEYGDYQCPYCALAHGLIRQILQAHGHRVCFVFRQFPLTGLHELALAAAEVAEAAATLGQFWPVHDWLFDHRDRWVEQGPAGLEQMPRELGIDADGLAQEILSGRPGGRVQQDLRGGLHSGVHSTPSFFINGRLFNGDVRALDSQVQAALAA